MNVIKWIKSLFISQKTPSSLYRSGMAKANKHDHEGAIADYTEAIGMHQVPEETIAMLLYNRALVYVASGDNEKGILDLNTVLGMKENLGNIKSMARQKLSRMEERNTNRND